jgi:hypothetical protein
MVTNFMKKKYILIIIIAFLVICIPFFTRLFVKLHKVTPMNQTKPSQFSSIPLPSNGAYVTEDSTTAPNVPYSALQGMIIRQTKEYKGEIWQQFIFDNQATGSKHVIFQQEESGIQFEKMTTQDWSPTNRFFYVLFDFPDGRRNMLVFETDGRFTDNQYYLEPVALKAFETISQTSWLNGETLSFTIRNQQTNTIAKYELDLNDSTGVIKQVE